MKTIFGKAFFKAFGTVTGIFVALAAISFVDSALSTKPDTEEKTEIKDDSAKENEIQ